jgi:hypothetical protein
MNGLMMQQPLLAPPRLAANRFPPLCRVLMEREKHAGPGRGHKGEKTVSRTGMSFWGYLKDIGLDKNRANEAERISAIPKEKLASCLFGDARSRSTIARPGAASVGDDLFRLTGDR